jgi:N-acetylmuramoyl-L-alanine amidase
MTLVYGTFPHPGFSDRLITNKPEGVGWNNLGKRKPYSLTLHRMIGNLWGTDAYFRDPSVPALTDYGMGCAAMDGAENAGVILRWVDPRGYVTPWASGPVSSPYGDGLCLVNFFGYADCANKNAVSIEISGNQTTPIDDFTYSELTKLCAYWIDQMAIPHDKLTDTPQTHCSGFVWHQEYTIGSGKECPFDVVMDLTSDLIYDSGVLLRPYQTGSEVPEPEPEPLPPDETDEDPGEAALPDGMTTEYAQRLYGEVLINGVEIGYDYNGDIASRHWMRRYAGQIPAGGSYTAVPWPFLVDVIKRGSGETADYQWSDGHLYTVHHDDWSDALMEAFA